MTARDPVAAARALLEKFHADYWDPPIGLKAIEGGRQVYATGPPCDSGEWVASFRDASGGDLFAAVGNGLLGELAAEVEWLREQMRADTELIRSVLGERNRAISHAVYSSDPAAVPLDEAMRRVARGTGLDFEIVENACLTAPTAEAIAELRGNLTGLPEGEADWRDHPVIEPDPAEAAQAEERARIEALAREEEARAKEEGRRWLFERAVEQWAALSVRGETKLTPSEYLGLTADQVRWFSETGEIPEGWEPPAGLQGEGE